MLVSPSFGEQHHFPDSTVGCETEYLPLLEWLRWPCLLLPALSPPSLQDQHLVRAHLGTPEQGERTPDGQVARCRLEAGLGQEAVRQPGGGASRGLGRVLWSSWQVPHECSWLRDRARCNPSVV